MPQRMDGRFYANFRARQACNFNRLSQNSLPTFVALEYEFHFARPQPGTEQEFFSNKFCLLHFAELSRKRGIELHLSKNTYRSLLLKNPRVNLP